MSLPEPYYQDDFVTLYHGDSLELLPLLPRVDLCLTDPPYMIGAVSAGNIGSKAGGWGDMMNSARWFRDWYSMIKRRLASNGALWTFCNWRSVPVVMRAAAEAEWSIASMLIWDKDWIGPGGSVGLRPAYEMVALCPMPDFQIPNRGLRDVWVEKWTAHKPNGHPAEKPTTLLGRLISESGSHNLVLDPFAGSGSTLKAAKNLGRKAIGIEIEERYCEIAAQRLAQDVLALGAE